MYQTLPGNNQQTDKVSDLVMKTADFWVQSVTKMFIKQVKQRSSSMLTHTVSLSLTYCVSLSTSPPEKDWTRFKEQM